MAESAFNGSTPLGRPTSSPEFFYTNAMYDDVFKTLGCAIRERQGLSLLIGESGTGKTKLIQLLSSTIEEQVRIFHCTSRPRTFADLLTTFGNLSVMPSHTNTVPVQLETLAEDLRLWTFYNGTTVLVIDDAHLLESAILAQLSLLLDLKSSSVSFLQIILVGHPALEKKLTRVELQPLRERVTAACHLHPLPPEEVRQLILQRYPSPKGLRQYLFTAEAIERISYASSGIPARINVLCDRALISAYARGQKVVSLQIIEDLPEDISPPPQRSSRPQLSSILPIATRDQEQHLVAVRNRASLYLLRHSILRFGRAFILIGFCAVFLLTGIMAKKFIPPVEQITATIPHMVQQTRSMLATLAQKVLTYLPTRQDRPPLPVPQKSGKLARYGQKDQ
jgi:type II secretory pathway predicted ATPase ExeA